MVDHGENGLTDRTVRIDADDSARGDQRRVHLLYARDPWHDDLRAFCLRMGLSHSRPPGFLRLVASESWNQAEAVPLAPSSLCPAGCRSLHVCLADILSTFP